MKELDSVSVWAGTQFLLCSHATMKYMGGKKGSGRETLSPSPDGTPIKLSELLDHHKEEIVAVRALVKASAEVKDLKDRCIYPEEDDLWIVRYLLNTKYTVEEATKRFINMIVARHNDPVANQVHKVLTENEGELYRQGQIKFPNVQGCFKAIPERLVHMYDKWGQPVSISCMGRSDLAYLMKLDDGIFQTYGFYKAEYVRLLVDQRSRETDQLVQLVQVVDLTGLGLTSHLNMSAFKRMNRMTKKLDNLYKETLGRIWVINAPFVFHQILKAGKFVMNERTAAKIQTVGGDMKKIAMVMDLDQIPEAVKNPKSATEKTGITLPDATPPAPPSSTHGTLSTE